MNTIQHPKTVDPISLGKKNARILSIDIDYFVTPTVHDGSLRQIRRLNKRTYQVDSIPMVKQLLYRCGLDSQRRVPGVFVRHHVAAFDVIRWLRQMAWFIDELVHVDAHSDLGLGDPGYVYLLTKLAHQPLQKRQNPKRGWKYLNLANWLPFVVANEWVKNIAFLPKDGCMSDSHPAYFRELILPSSTRLEIRKATEDDVGTMVGSDSVLRTQAFDRVPVVASARFRICDPLAFTCDPPDFVIVCQSPQFTPRTADAVIELCREFVCEIALPDGVEGPI